MYAFEPANSRDYDPYIYHHLNQLEAQVAYYPSPARQSRQRLSRSNSTGHTRRWKHGEDRRGRRASYQEDETCYDDEDDLIDQRQREAAENAIRNQLMRPYNEDEFVVPVSSISSPTNVTPTSEDVSSSLATPPSLPSQPPSVATAAAKKPRRRWPLSFLFKRPSFTPAPSPSQSLSTTNSSQSSSSNNRLKSMQTSPFPDLAQDRNSVPARQVDRSAPSSALSPAVDTRVANLDHLWVFRFQKSHSGAQNLDNVWTAFDYDNQQLLKEHEQRLRDNVYSLDAGVELFDSHIQQAQLPVLVLTSRQTCYYPMDTSGNNIGTLEVACLENAPNVEFVYRQHFS
ncbi:hypothetical protein DFQ30_000301 [Apophysomyces sp. BC1015]|nr:hypothetical protein DFQ30_000301 [Apophysomyces sp. BC1015]